MLKNYVYMLNATMFCFCFRIITIFFMKSCHFSIAQNDIVDWNENELNNISDETNNYNSHHTGLQDLCVFCAIWTSAFVEEILTIIYELLQFLNYSFYFFFLFLSTHCVFFVIFIFNFL